MATAAAQDDTRTARGRRAPKPTGDDRERAILATAEQLLAERTLAEISIDDLAKGAGISRSTFYFYFPSKDAVLLALMDQVIAEGNAASLPTLDEIAADPAGTWRRTINSIYTTFRSHRAVTIAAAQAQGTDSEARRLWSRVMNDWVSMTAAAIEAERARGAAPEGLPARDLAITLNLMNERVLYATFAEVSPAIAEHDVVSVLHAMWLNAIYHSQSPRGA